MKEGGRHVSRMSGGAAAKQAREAADAASYPLGYHESRDLLAKAEDLRSQASAQSHSQTLAARGRPMRYGWGQIFRRYCKK
jgi:hypothetical protein